MKVTCWVKTGYRRETRAIFYAERIIKELKKSTQFQLCNGEKISVKHDDIISIEEEEA